MIVDSAAAMQSAGKAPYRLMFEVEPWDGPAAILFSDGQKVGAVLDRNGLRPSRYYLTNDNMLILSSEVGVLDIDEKKIIKKLYFPKIYDNF